jgi:protein gp37
MHPDWARSVRDQCATAGVPFFLKQLDAKHKREMDDRTHDAVPWRMIS